MYANATTNPWELDHEDFPREDWRYQVQNNDTLLGYREWLNVQLELNGREDEIEQPPPIIVEVKDNTVHDVHNIPSGVLVRMEEHDLDDLDGDGDEDFQDSLLYPRKRIYVREFRA